MSVFSLMVLALGAGCGGPMEDRVSAAELAGARAGELALIPAVDVDGLEELTNRSAGSVFLEEVIMHARSVRIWDTDGRSQDIRGSSRYFLRYSPAAGEAGLSRLWAPADGQYSDLTLEVGPLFLTPETVREEGRARGFDLTDLNEASVVIRGVVAVESSTGRPLFGEMAAGEGCGADSVLCDGTVPDTEPARVLAMRSNDSARVDNGTVPDTEPARDEVTNRSQGLQLTPGGDGTLPTRTFKPFVLISSGSFSLGTTLDPVVAQGGGVVRLHLDINSLFSDERLAELQSAARTAAEPVLTRQLRGDEMGKSFHVQAGEVANLAGPRTR